MFAKHPELEATWAARIQALQDETECYQRTLAELRKARRMTQVALAAEMGVNQSKVSRIEPRADTYLPTLERYVAAFGGEPRLLAVFEGEEFDLKLADLAGEPETAPEREQELALAG